ncbi:hypothetical protein BCR37DRAFT_263427 [Protomyces lactucae-debilis]|uniref:histidine kinase n=1 Tax=Protomyces lactucae-debilis TaxID=2754530 RepID=A0A1Y2FLS1_PROLT|nr:uncharacterized protein BCR37DRAFT_263427 [Protomyces lactucae-debilis]ORY84304.1 hypothetical protein BCR37DRAFT_263427 [Protomyces lactucae-debilis]
MDSQGHLRTLAVPAAIVSLQGDHHDVLRSNDLFAQADCEADLGALQPFIKAATPSIRIVQLAAVREYTLSPCDTPDTILLQLIKHEPLPITGDPEAKRRLCLRKAKNRSEEDHAHALRVFEFASQQDRLGPIQTWPDALWRALYSMFDCYTASGIEWGHDFRLLYNYQYRIIAGARHPDALGLPMRHEKCWGDIWTALQPQMQSVMCGNAASNQDVQFMIDDAETGRPLERYFDYGFTPIDDDHGNSLGILSTGTERTEQVFNDRCFGVAMSAIVKEVTYKTKPSEFYSSMAKGLQANPQDLPVVLVYSVQDSFASLTVKIANLADKSRPLPERHCMGGLSEHVIGRLLNEVNSQRRPIETSDSFLHNLIIADNQRCQRAILFPIASDVTGKLLAAVFIGLNPHRRLQGSYRAYLDMLIGHLGSGIRNMNHMKAQLMHHEDVATLNQARSSELQAKLEERSKELFDAEMRFSNMAEYSPAGIFLISPQGSVIFCNDAAWTLAGAQKPDFEVIDSLLQDARTWAHEDNVEYYKAELAIMFTELRPVAFTYRAAMDWPDGRARWLRVTTRVELNSDGTPRLFHGFCMDVSHVKQLEELTNKHMADAAESKRQQEAFIDMASHEIRNPLSAIGQTAELVTSGLRKALRMQSVEEIRTALSEALDMIVNVDLLARHMRCIADDMIAVSKINSDLLRVRPTAIVVTDYLQQVLGMFAAEAKAQNIRVTLVADKESVVEGETRCLIDPARVSQVLINLITSAIKHMSRNVAAGEKQKAVDVSVRLSSEAPFPADLYGATTESHSSPMEEIVQDKRATSHETEQYLVFAVQDNGLGMSQEDAEAIFRRFTQSGPKTHNKYGGTGISLFICRRLAELQGGQIRSEPPPSGAPGTRFVFYVRAPPCGEGQATTTTPMEVLSDDYFAHFTRPSALEHSPSEVLIPPPEAPTPAYSMSAIPRSEPQKATDPVQQHFDRIRALIVEDNILNQRLLQKQLQKAGYDVEVANNGLECLTKVREEPSFDVILLDREMPVCDGLACLLQLRELEKQGIVVSKERKASTQSQASSHVPIFDRATLEDQEYPDPEGYLDSRSKPTVTAESSSISPSMTPDASGHVATPSAKRRRSSRPITTNKKQHVDEPEYEGPRNTKLAVITISANARSEQIEEMMNAGSDDYVTKPFRFPDLDARIKKLLTTLADC